MNKTWFAGKLLLMVLVYFLFIEDGVEKGTKEFRQKDWVSTKGKIIAVQVSEKPYMAGKKYITEVLQYSYTWVGKNYKSADVLVQDEIYPNYVMLEVLKKKKELEYMPESEIEVRVNSKDPSISTTIDASDSYLFQIIFGLMVEVVLLIFVIRDIRKEIAIRKE